MYPDVIPRTVSVSDDPRLASGPSATRFEFGPCATRFNSDPRVTRCLSARRPGPARARHGGTGRMIPSLQLRAVDIDHRLIVDAIQHNPALSDVPVMIRLASGSGEAASLPHEKQGIRTR